MASSESITNRIFHEIGLDPIHELLSEDTQVSRSQEPGQRIIQASIEVAELLGNNGVLPPLGGFPTEHPFDEVLERLDIERPSGPKDKRFWVLELHFHKRGKTWGTGLQADGSLLTLPEGSGVGPNAKPLFKDRYNADTRGFGPGFRAERWCDRLVAFGATMMKGGSYNPWIFDHEPVPVPTPPRTSYPEPRSLPSSTYGPSHSGYTTPFVPAGSRSEPDRRFS